jgi:DNA-binding NtrC family response regulator
MLANRRILVVDDQPSVCESVEKILRKRGCNIEQAFDGQAAIDLLENETFDLLIADLMMPRVSGMELLRFVKQHHPETEVVMITGFASIESAVEATKIGAAGYVPKPFTPEELTTVTEKALAARATKEAAKPAQRPAALAPEAAPAVAQKMDADEPFDRRQVAEATSEEYADALSRSDIPRGTPVADPIWCAKGEMSCKKFAKSGPCKGECLILVREQKLKAQQQPAGLTVGAAKFMDVDMPFDFDELAAATSPAYAATASRSDIPVRTPGWEVYAEGRDILVIDDEPVVCNSLRRILSRSGHRVDQALLPEEGLEKIGANRYDLVMLDLRMPGKDGLEVLSAIKERWPETKVIIVTGYASIESAIEATRRGASQYLAKPFTPEEVSRATTAVLEEVAA